MNSRDFDISPFSRHSQYARDFVISSVSGHFPYSKDLSDFARVQPSINPKKGVKSFVHNVRFVILTSLSTDIESTEEL